MTEPSEILTDTIYKNIKPQPQYCSDHKPLSEDIILIKNELGIKEQKNGERDRQIKYAWQRINGLGKKTEEEDNTLRDDLDKVRDDVVDLKVDIAIIKSKVLKEDEKKNREWSLQEKVIIAILTSILAPLIVLLIVFLIKTFIWGF